MVKTLVLVGVMVCALSGGAVAQEAPRRAQTFAPPPDPPKMVLVAKELLHDTTGAEIHGMTVFFLADKGIPDTCVMVIVEDIVPQARITQRMPWASCLERSKGTLPALAVK